MNPARLHFLLTPLLAATMLLAACASREPTLGEKLQGQGKVIQKIGKSWSEGNTMATQGNILIEKGNKKIAQGRSLLSAGTDEVRKGESMIAEGQAIKAAAEKAYDTKIDPFPVMLDKAQ